MDARSSHTSIRARMRSSRARNRSSRRTFARRSALRCSLATRSWACCTSTTHRSAAALAMSGVATAFNIFTRTDPTPADLMRELNATLAPKTAPTKFVTMVVGVLDPTNGRVEFANAGHVPPLVVTSVGVEPLRSTDLVVGLFPNAQYRNQTIELKPGDSMVLFTDGVTEAENSLEEQ